MTKVSEKFTVLYIKIIDDTEKSLALIKIKRELKKVSPYFCPSFSYHLDFYNYSLKWNKIVFFLYKLMENFDRIMVGLFATWLVYSKVKYI